MRYAEMKALLLLLFAFNAHADGGIIMGNINSDKGLHVVGVMAITAVVSDATKSEAWGLGAGVAVSAYREVYKIKHPGYHASWLSVGSDALGLYLGHKLVEKMPGVKLVFAPGVMQVSYAREF